jgi:hypothetical protein
MVKKSPFWFGKTDLVALSRHQPPTQTVNFAAYFPK